MADKEQTLYEKMVALGVEIDHHESDMYVPVTPETTRLVMELRRETAGRLGIAETRVFTHANVFTHQQHRTSWYDIPFAYQPWWQARAC